MKKAFLVALFASLFLLSGCSKKESKTDPTPEAQNPIVAVFDYCVKFFYADATAVATQLVNDGWQIRSTSGSQSYTLTKNGVVVTIYIYEINNVVKKISLDMQDDDAKTTLTDGETVKEFMSHVGSSYTLNNDACAFSQMKYEDGESFVSEFDYNTALGMVVASCDEGNIQLYWQGKTHDFSMSKMYTLSETGGQDVIMIELK